MLQVLHSRPITVPRTTAFGTHTYFPTRWDCFLTAAKLRLLSSLKPEHDARSLGSLHFAYWTLLPRGRIAKLLGARGMGISRRLDQMLFLSDFSGDWEVYLVGFNKLLLSALDLAWGGSLGWKRKMELDDYLRFVRKHEITRQFHFQAYGEHASVEDVRCALHVSEELDRFVCEVHAADPARFDAAYRRLRIRLGSCLAA